MTNPFGEPAENEEDDLFEADVSVANLGQCPEGAYLMRCVDIEKRISNAGNNMWVWTFAIVEAANEAGAKAVGVELKLFTALTAAAMWKLNETIEALQLPTKDGKLRASKSDIIGTECVGLVEDQEFNGRTNSAIKRCVPKTEWKCSGPV